MSRSSGWLLVALLACRPAPSTEALCRAFAGDDGGARADALVALMRELGRERGEPDAGLRRCLAERVVAAPALQRAVSGTCAGRPEELDVNVPEDLGVPPWLELTGFLRAFDPRSSPTHARLAAEYEKLRDECARAGSPTL